MDFSDYGERFFDVLDYHLNGAVPNSLYHIQSGPFYNLGAGIHSCTLHHCTCLKLKELVVNTPLFKTLVLIDVVALLESKPFGNCSLEKFELVRCSSLPDPPEVVGQLKDLEVEGQLKDLRIENCILGGSFKITAPLLRSFYLSIMNLPTYIFVDVGPVETVELDFTYVGRAMLK